MISFYLGALTGVISALGMVGQYFVEGRTPFQSLGIVPWLELCGAGVTNFMAVNFLTMSFQQGAPAATAILSYIQVFYNYLADLVFFDVNFSAFQYVGIIVTLSFSLVPAVIKLLNELKNK